MSTPCRKAGFVFLPNIILALFISAVLGDKVSERQKNPGQVTERCRAVYGGGKSGFVNYSVPPSFILRLENIFASMGGGKL